jgi:chaperonin GroEL
VSFLRAIPKLEEAIPSLEGDEKIGFQIVAEALRGPLRQIVDNAGEDGDVVVEEVLGKGGSHGYDAASSQYVDMVQAGIIDPALVARTALLNAASVAGLMLTTNVLVSDLDEDEELIEAAVS